MAGDRRYGVQIQGAKELRRALKGAEVDLKDLRATHLRVAKIVATTAKNETVPVRSGALQRSIRATATQKRGEVRAGNLTRGKRGKGAVYAPIIEYGNAHRNIKPQFYLIRALAKNRRRVAAEYEREIERLLHKNNINTWGW